MIKWFNNLNKNVKAFIGFWLMGIFAFICIRMFDWIVNGVDCQAHPMIAPRLRLMAGHLKIMADRDPDQQLCL